MATLRQKYEAQRHGAKRRGIEWRLTFEQWLEWWGDDIHRRGPGADQLGMQRVGDAGPYAFGNIRKGHPRENSRTYFQISRLNRESERLRLTRQPPVVEPPDPVTEDEEFLLTLARPTSVWDSYPEA